MKKKIQPRVLGLFSGGGGLEIGFADANFSLVASVEVVPDFCRTLEANSDTFGKTHRVFCSDIAEFIPAEHGISGIDFVIGGPPCQSFSAAGRRAGGVYGLNDLRGSLFWHYCRILRDLKPTGFLFENVRGILSANNKAAWSVITQSFAELGYSLHFQVLDAAEYGVPQHRERVILVGLKDELTFQFPWPTHGPSSKTRSNYVSASEAVSSLQDKDEEYVSYGGKYEAELLEIPPGSNYLHFTEKMGHPEPRFAWRSRFSDFLYVADPALPTKTIVAHPGKWAGPFHWNKRKFTVPELKRLFTFPDGYELHGSEITQIKQLGNSVPPRLAKILAQAVGKQAFGFPLDIDLVGPNFRFDHDQRKGRKAKATKRKVVKNSEIYHKSTGQRLLFDESHGTEFEQDQSICKTLTYTDFRECLAEKASLKSHQTFQLSMELKAGHWNIDIRTRKRQRKAATFELQFHRTVLGAFNRISVTLRSDDLRYIAVAWDCVNLAVASSTSYDCIQKLYGHFSEPYPLFDLTFKSMSEGDPICQLQKEISNYSFLKGYHELGWLERMFAGRYDQPKDGRQIALWLRQLGFDIRTNETNRTIPDGAFRICYPFTMPLDAYNFITWREKGSHATADRTSIPEKSI